MNKQKRIRQEKGITLIALIITIVVLLILAVVTINSIQGDGIIQYASNAVDDYTAKSNEEQEKINTLLGQIEESLKEKITWTKTSTGDLAVGSTVVTSTGENFYVIGFKDNNETVKLLAKNYIVVNEKDENYLKQNPNISYEETVAFCEDSVGGYWGDGDSPYDIIEEMQPIPNTHTAAYAADRYGASLGVKGRLMLYFEAETLKSANSDILDSNEHFWLGSADTTSTVWAISGSSSFETCGYSYSVDYYVRPVVEISISKIS